MFKEKDTYNPLKKYVKKANESTLGCMYSFTWENDPKHLVFPLSRYKFISKIIEGKKNVLEVGCADGWPSRIVRQNVHKLTAIDFDPTFIKIAQRNNNKKFKIDFHVHDITKNSFGNKRFDAIYSLDVLEHIPKKVETSFIKNIIKSLNNSGTLIIGVPTLESQGNLKQRKAKGHINCKTGKELKSFLNKYFKNVYLLSMNDELVHTGLTKMSNYLICICNSAKR